MKKQLPKYFVIKNPGNTSLWKKYIEWFSEMANTPFQGNVSYYGFDGIYDYWSSIGFFKNNPTEITLEYWNECINGFQLPEKWCVKKTLKNKDVINKWFNETFNTKYLSLGYIYSKKVEDNSLGHYIKEVTPKLDEFTEITFEQFKEYVLMDEKKDFEILEFIDLTKLVKKEDGLFYRENTSNKGLYESQIAHFRINKVKRLSDGQIFTLGDTHTWNNKPISKIKEFQILNNKLFAKLENGYEESINNLTKQNTMENKKIIGYKTPMDLFEGRIKKGDIYLKGKIGKSGYYPSHLTNLPELYLPKEIVEQWKAVYEQEEKIIRMGNTFDLKVTNEGIFHNKTENITNFVKEVNELWNQTLNKGRLKLAKYDFFIEPDELISFKNGCQNTKVSIKEWLNVWEEYNKMSK